MYFLFLQGEVPTDSFFHALLDKIFHRTTCYQVLNHLLAIAKDPVTERVEAGFIHPDDAKYNLFFRGEPPPVCGSLELCPRYHQVQG